MTHSKLICAAARTLKLGALVAAFSAAAGCSDFLKATNPGAVEETDVTNPANISIIANAPIYGYQLAYTDVTYWNGQLTDELFNRAVFVEEGQIDRRELYSDMSYINAFIYGPAQRARYLGEDAARRLKDILADSASRDIRVARSLAYAGHSYILLGETMCVTPIDLGVPKTSAQIFGDAITNFDEAIAIATAARAHLQAQPVPNANAIAATDSVRFFALVGAARAALNRNDKPAAIAYANQVPAAFVFRAYYTDNTAQQRNRTYERLTVGSNANLLNTPFEAMTTDPRVPRIGGTTARAGIPLSPPSYSTYSATVAGAAFAPIMSVRIASGLEAEYIRAEAEGPTPATLIFVNARRSANGQTATAVVGDELMAELRDQRSRDFYLDGHRLGDLRRYKEFYNVDLFPSGPYPGSTSGAVYDPNITCWPLPTNEINGNPNI
ncbi:MAG TPA: RagB/SusD family nutrient uptake outer membrane protein [Gemmatimonadaceae bacterium]|nr:RagB/SusD family nutrient uptake outer membrane protein [Gemmatimonadaceae bacterium]